MRLSIPTHYFYFTQSKKIYRNFFHNFFAACKLKIKMPICLWKGCELAFEEFAAFQQHVNTKHVQQQEPPQQQLNLDKQNDSAIKESMPKMAKLSLLDENKMIKKGGQR
jgi:hypothetical protein